MSGQSAQKKLLVRVQYPQPKSGKRVDTTVLDNVLKAIRKSENTIGYDCCLGARLTAADSQSTTASNFKSSASVSGPPSSDAVRLVVDDQYYCKTACDGIDADSVPKLAKPTILVEVYFNHYDTAETQKKILGDIYKAIKTNLATCLQDPATSGDIDICIMNFFLGKDDNDPSDKLGHHTRDKGCHRYPLYMSFDCDHC